MNATNRKIDTKSDPANDPAMAAFKAGRLQSILADIRQDNPIAKPDRPHPPVEELKSATALDAEREELKRAIEPDAPGLTAPAASAAPAIPEPRAGTSSAGAAQPTPDAAIELKAEKPELRAPDTTGDQPNNLPVGDAAVHANSQEPAKRLRGRPRVSDEKKRESSYTLSPHIADRVRDLAAMEQLRLKRTISASAIVEAMIEIAEKHLQDNKVLTH